MGMKSHIRPFQTVFHTKLSLIWEWNFKWLTIIVAFSWIIPYMEMKICHAMDLCKSEYKVIPYMGMKITFLSVLSRVFPKLSLIWEWNINSNFIFFSAFGVIPYMGMKFLPSICNMVYLMSYSLYGNEIKNVNIIASILIELSLIWEWNYILYSS